MKSVSTSTFLLSHIPYHTEDRRADTVYGLLPPLPPTDTQCIKPPPSASCFTSFNTQSGSTPACACLSKRHHRLEALCETFLQSLWLLCGGLHPSPLPREASHLLLSYVFDANRDCRLYCPGRRFWIPRDVELGAAGLSSLLYRLNAALPSNMTRSIVWLYLSSNWDDRTLWERGGSRISALWTIYSMSSAWLMPGKPTFAAFKLTARHPRTRRIRCPVRGTGKVSGTTQY